MTMISIGKKSKKSTEGARLLLQPEFCEPQSSFDSLMRDLLHRVIEERGSVTLDITNMIRPDFNPRTPGVIKWDYGAWVGDEKLRNSGKEVPFDKISRLEITLWFEPQTS